MWIHVLEEEKRSYYFKYHACNESYFFYLTNFVQIWELVLSKIDLALLIQEHNPIIIEADNTSLTKSFLEILHESLTKKKTETSVDDSLPEECVVLKIKIIKGELSFKIVFRFNASSPQKFFQEVTIPLITSLKEFKESEKHLVESLQKKDVEIQDYKSEGAKLSLKHLETITFNAEEHKNMYTPSSECVLSTVDASSILKLAKENENISVVQDSKDNLSKTLIKSEDLMEDKISDIKPNCDNLKRELDNNNASGTFPVVKNETEALYSETICLTTQEKRKRKKLLNF